MKILFDSHIFGLQQVGGISRYFVELASQLVNIDGVDARILAPLHINRLLLESSVRRLSLNVNAGRINFRSRLWLDRLISQAMTAAMAPDVLHTTYYLQHSRPYRAKALVLTVHDMIHELFPADFPVDDLTAARKKRAVAAADHIICVSEKTRNDLCQILGVDISRTSVVYHGVSPKRKSSCPVPGLHRPYLLFVGQRGGYKNFAMLLRAVAGSRKLREGFRIVAFGATPFSVGEIGLMSSLGLARDAVTYSSGSDAALDSLYSAAACFVYPSAYEGFGMPLLEAMSIGCPVVAAHTSCIPEVAGDAAEFFDASSSDALAAAILKVVSSPGRSLDLTRAGYARAANFTWQNTARKTLEVYRMVR